MAGRVVVRKRTREGSSSAKKTTTLTTKKKTKKKKDTKGEERGGKKERKRSFVFFGILEIGMVSILARSGVDLYVRARRDENAEILERSKGRQ